MDAAAKVVLVEKLSLLQRLRMSIRWPDHLASRRFRSPWWACSNPGAAFTDKTRTILVIIPISTAKKKVLGANLANAASVGSISVARGSNTMASAQ
ncbi:MAG: hypothetical protein U0Q16_36640 [Bryobacteraceae bacterium]